MKQRAVLFCAIALFALPTVALSADPQPAPAPQKNKARVVAETMVAENAVVKAIDMNKRTVTLAMADGKERTFVIDKRVKKLGQVKVGDTVKAKYYEAVSVRLRKTKTEPSVTVDAGIARDQESVKPSGIAARQVTTIATIDKIFNNGKSVTLKGPMGNSIDVKVRDPENLAMIQKGEVKEGDQVEITYTQALAIAVEKVVKK